jgi:hypothetical protein
MNKNLLSPRFVFVISVIIAGAFMRLMPHWPNLTPIAAMALFGGAYISKKYLAFIIPMAAMLLSDVILGFHSSMVAVYVGFAITVSLGIMISKNVKIVSVLGASLLSTVIFFIITNFASWLGNPLYPQSFIGLTEAYTAGLMFFNDGSYGISFFLNSILGDIMYNTLFFGAFYLVRVKFPVLAKA